jgi:hypothetical protein
MNYANTVINCLTAGYPQGANLPVYLDSDKQIVDAALAICGTRQAENARIMHIRNTLQVEEVEVSEPCMKELEKKTNFSVVKGPYDLTFDTEGNLPNV